jgi:hypothetical protein
MSRPASAVARPRLIQYAFGFDAVLIAVGVGLLLPTHAGVPIVPFAARALDDFR